MGLFDKKYCDVCGEKIGMLGNRKLDDGNLCKDCAKKLSPWFEERRHSTVDAIKEQLAYREANKEKVRTFRITRDFAADSYHVFIDENQRQFAVARAMNEETNPDIVDFSQVLSCRLEVKENRQQEQYKDREGNMKYYNPPRYKYSYDYWIRLAVKSPWFDDMDFQLNTFDIEQHERGKIMEMENLGNQIVAALTGGVYNQQMGMSGMGMMNGGMQGQNMGMMNGGMQGQNMGMMNGGMQGQNMGMMNGGMQGQSMGMMNGRMQGQNMGMMNGGMQGQNMGMMNGGMQGQNMGMMNGGMVNQGIQETQNAAGNTWQCASCGAVNTTKFCQQCGQPRPAVQRNDNNSTGYQVRCDKCGWIIHVTQNGPRFCPNCGDPVDARDC